MKNKRSRWGTAALTAAIALLLCACGAAGNTPSPERTTTEDSDNSFGARWSFTLDEFSEAAAEELENADVRLSDDKWETINAGLIDDNGVTYSSFCRHAEQITFIAAVEDDSNKVMNIGCGCETELLEDEAFRSKLIDVAAITALNAGGYAGETKAYFISAFTTLLDSDDDTLYHGDQLFIKSVDNKTTVLMTAPCSGKVREKNHYKTVEEEQGSR